MTQLVSPEPAKAHSATFTEVDMNGNQIYYESELGIYIRGV